jgi:hypothetical protein
MKNIIKKIYTVLVLIKNLIFKKQKYTLHFIAETNPPIKLWYYDFKHWGFDKHNLLMVSGADNLCELYAKGKNEVTVQLITTNKPIEDKNVNKNYDLFTAEELPQNTKFIDKILYGRNYTQIKTIYDDNLKEQIQIRTMWICPVTLFVLGRYPKYIYIKRK